MFPFRSGIRCRCRSLRLFLIESVALGEQLRPPVGTGLRFQSGLDADAAGRELAGHSHFLGQETNATDVASVLRWRLFLDRHCIFPRNPKRRAPSTVACHARAYGAAGTSIKPGRRSRIRTRGAIDDEGPVSVSSNGIMSFRTGARRGYVAEARTRVSVTCRGSMWHLADGGSPYVIAMPRRRRS